MSSSSSAASYALPATSQFGPRDAVQPAIFFRLDTSNKDLVQKCSEHLEQSLHHLQPGFPYLRCSLRQDNTGVVRVEPVPGGTKVHCVTVDSQVTRAIEYDRSAQGLFPPNSIPWDQLAIPNHSLASGDAQPTAGIYIFVLDGGLLVVPFIHHCIGDGTHMALFLTALAAATRRSEDNLVEDLPAIPTTDLSYKKIIQPGNKTGESKEFLKLLRQCPEYRYNAKGLQPCAFTEQTPANPPLNTLKDSEIIAIPKSYIAERKTNLTSSGQPEPTTYTLLAALIWSHVTRARQNEHHQENTHPPPGSEHSDPIPEHIARMIMPVDWTKRVEDPPKEFGFYGIWAVASIEYTTLLEASNPNTSAQQRDTALAQVIEAIAAAIRAVNQAYVSTRLSLVRHASDPRVLGLHFDPRCKKDMIFNTWQFMGADLEWMLDGQGPGVRPVMRKVGIPSPGSGLVLPARKDAEEIEVQVSVPKDSMRVFRQGGLGGYVL
ncbi:hypothetical protein GGR57DRAFT_513654 [Xylariaceae sp. FL1272]|nr:hypothetical protein GGR57DRAFT_513654 [Xylariaceae sp. FL1272]